MRQRLLKITVLGLLTLFIESCGSDKSDSRDAVKEIISFPTVEFTISPKTDTTIFGQQGTRLFIEKETFQFSDGRAVTDSVVIKLKEFYKKSDIALADLSTISDGKLLETGGMLSILAFSRGEEIQIKNNKTIIIHFPKKKNTEQQMSLFYATNPIVDSSVSNWKIDTANLLKQVPKIGTFGYYWVSGADSTDFEFKPKNFVDTGYYFSPLNNYLNTYPFSSATLKAIDEKGIGIDGIITKGGRFKNVKLDTKISKEASAEILKFINDLPELEPGKNNKNEIIERKVSLFIQVDNIPMQRTNADYISSFNSKYSKYENEPIRSINDAELNYFIFSVVKLGWINCDRFLEFEKKVDYIVQTPSTKDTKIKMVFKDIDGVLMAEAADGKFIFSNVPVGKAVTIFAIKNADGQFQTALHEVTIPDKPLETLAFKETTLADLRKQLEKLN